MSVFFDPHTVTLDSATPTGCTSISVQSGSQPQTARSDAGTLVHFAPTAGVRGTINFNDPVQALTIANKGGAGSLDLTFDVVDDVGTDPDKVVTIANCKTGGVGMNFAGMAVGSASVGFVGDSVAGPA